MKRSPLDHVGRPGNSRRFEPSGRMMKSPPMHPTLPGHDRAASQPPADDQVGVSTENGIGPDIRVPSMRTTSNVASGCRARTTADPPGAKRGSQYPVGMGAGDAPTAGGAAGRGVDGVVPVGSGRTL